MRTLSGNLLLRTLADTLMRWTKVDKALADSPILDGSAISRLLRFQKAPEELSAGELEEMAKFACTAASLSTEALGGIPSIPAEEALLRRIHA